MNSFLLLLLFSLFFLNLIFIIKFEFISNLVNIFDKPDNQLKLHKKIIPLLGGIIFLINLILVFIFQFFFSEFFFVVKKNEINLIEIISLFFLIMGFFSLGLYDDKFKIRPHIKIIISSITIILALLINKNLVISDLKFSFYNNVIILNNLSFLFTLFCFLILKNSLNFYDGINGQSGFFYIMVFSYLFYTSGLNIFYLAIIIIITYLLFLNLNNKLFFGDSGVLLISALLSVSLIYEYKKNQNIIYADEIFLLLLLPGIDLVRLTITRLLSGRNAFYGDRNHLHHLLYKRYSLATSNIVLSILSLTPILLFIFFEKNFFNSIIFFCLIYSLIIFMLKKIN